MTCNAGQIPRMHVRSTWIHLRFHMREDLAIAAVVAVIAGFLVLTFIPFRAPNSGFGPDWDCTNPGQGGPACVKREAAPEIPG